jgi:iron complex outermembrane receptor protein
VRANGLELEAQMRLGAGLQGLMSYAVQRAIDQDTRAALVNSPRHMAKVRMSVPGPIARSFLSMEVLLLGTRETIAGDTLGATATANVHVIVPLRRAFELTGGIRNMFDKAYFDPASDAHLQDTIPQNGRTLRVGLRWKLWAK